MQEGKMLMLIYILVRPSSWALAVDSGLFYERSLSNEGFIHASSWRQLDRVANHYFADTNELLLIGVDPAQVKPPIRWEISASTGDRYPHIYGPLNVDATVILQTFQRSPNGRFELPTTEPVFQKI
jgi:uncharacterized protein (DUF952 family)